MDYADLIGTPFQWGGRGPDSYDCFGLVMMLFRVEQGIEVPDVARATCAAEAAIVMRDNAWRWTRIEASEKGCLMFMRARGLGSHVGYCIGQGRFIHVWEDSGGVCVERISDWRNRTVGFYRFGAGQSQS
jgi:cell wall-associated NlpC family hydrolase